jgi:cytochrome P450
MILLYGLVFLILLGVFAWRCYANGIAFILPPAHLPRNIPTIPFWFCLLPLIKEVDQEELWHKYLKEPLFKYGAVKMYFGGAWNVLITKPQFIAQVLKQDDVFPKAGNHIKNPHSILALYTGENVISEIGDKWKTFAGIVKPGLQADVDLSIVEKNAHKLVGLLCEEQERMGTVVMPRPLQDYTLANLSEVMLGAPFNVSFPSIAARLHADKV